MKKILIRVIPVVCFILLITLMNACKSDKKGEKELESFNKAWQESKFEEMYKAIDAETKGKIPEKDFTQRYKNIYSGMGANNIKLKWDYSKVTYFDNKTRASVPFTLSMDTDAGHIDFNENIALKQGSDKKQWEIVWTPSLIIPGLENDDKIRVDTTSGTRGEIRDRNNNPLAINGVADNVGIVPGKLGSDAENGKKKIGDLLQVSIDTINKSLTASYVKPDTFVPIKVISDDDRTLKDKLLAIPGVKIIDKKARVYPLKEKAAHLVGYVQNVSAEDIKKLKDQGYKDGDVIGKTGLEAIYEKSLKAQNGCEIYIVDSNNNKKKTIIKKDPQNGEDLKLTIDINVQSRLYDQLNGDAGTAAAMNPSTGEMLALVSTPSFNPNDFVLGMSDAEWKALNDDVKKPLYNRFESSFCPGSVFKPVTAAIGLETSKIDPNAAKTITGLKWQKSSSWGDYWVTRVSQYAEPSNLMNALKYSDNIYFAQAALDIGSDKFIENVKKFGIGEKVPFEYGMTASQFDADGKIKDEVQLADSGYGQGEILMNPVHLASIYSAFVNKGNMIKPYLKYKDSPSAEFWKNNVMSEATANEVLKDLKEVIASPNGTGHQAFINGLTLAGKTGTAEIKQSQNDTNGTELGWFAALNTDNPKLLVISMIEDVKGRGGSHYVVPKVKKIFENLK